MSVIHLLGSEGFIGRAIQREAGNVNLQCWSHVNRGTANHFDLFDQSTWHAFIAQRPTHAIILSWPGLSNYNDAFHLTHNLPACIELVERLINAGLKNLVVAGTCYEYGLQNGQLRESHLSDPLNCYSIAKDSLRRLIQNRYKQKDVRWCWLRIFYPYGEGQNPNSLLPSLERAIEKGNSTFDMSSGRQIRDFLPVQLVAKHALALSKNPLAFGIYNSCSGKPRSIREIVEARVKETESKIALNFGFYPDRIDEPLAFWGCPKRINEATKDW